MLLLFESKEWVLEWQDNQAMFINSNETKKQIKKDKAQCKCLRKRLKEFGLC